MVGLINHMARHVDEKRLEQVSLIDISQLLRNKILNGYAVINFVLHQESESTNTASLRRNCADSRHSN